MDKETAKRKYDESWVRFANKILEDPTQARKNVTASLTVFTFVAILTGALLASAIWVAVLY